MVFNVNVARWSAAPFERHPKLYPLRNFRSAAIRDAIEYESLPPNGPFCHLCRRLFLFV